LGSLENLFNPIKPIVFVGLLLPLAAFGEPPGSFPLTWAEPRRAGVAPKSIVELPNGALVTADTRRTSDSVQILCFRSLDSADTWTTAGVVASDPDRRTDLSDCALLVRKNGELLVSYRHNNYRGLQTEERRFSIYVARSHDGGLTWQKPEIVDDTRGTTAGLWASFLFETAEGQLQCYYDDEVTPWREGFRRHQWLTMKTWNPATERWTSPTTVSRAHNPSHLSRDGMCTVVETAPGKLLCVFESVDVEAPFHGVLRSSTSEDNGQTWSWHQRERPIVWRPEKRPFSALAPWTIRLSSGPLLCVFVTDEDRKVPDVPATGQLHMDVKAVYSYDRGETWSKLAQTVAAEHPNYLPGVVEITRGPRKGQVLLQYTRPFGGRYVRFGTPAATDRSQVLPTTSAEFQTSSDEP